LVQLKATESSKQASARKVDLSIDTVRYYKQLELPVLIARYSETEDRFYCKWDHEIDLYYAKKNAKTIRISFSDTDIWGSDSAARTISYLKRLRAIKSGAITLPVSVSLDVAGDSVKGVSRGILSSEFRLALKNYSHLAVYESNAENSGLRITVTGDELSVSLSAVTGCTFHHVVKHQDESFAETIAAYSMLGFAVAMAQLGQLEVAARVFLDKNLIGRFLQWEDLFKQFIPMLIRTSRYGELIDGVCEVIGSNSDDNVLENVTVASVLFNSNSGDAARNIKFQQLLERCLDKSVRIGEKPLIGMAHYNLANHYRCRGLVKQAVHHYLLARRFFPKYLDQTYFYRELGGALFELGRYRFSTRMYERALDMGAPSDVKALYADALMFGGFFKRALDIFNEYIHSGTDVRSEWLLKAMFLESVVKNTGIYIQERRGKQARDKVDVAKASDPVTFESELNSSVMADMLCGLAWFNMGILRSSQKRHGEAAFSFIACGLVQTGDIEAWVNATLSCLSQGQVDALFLQVIDAAYRFNGDEYSTMLHQKLADSFSGHYLEAITNLLDAAMPKDSSSDSKPALRFMHEDGILRDVFTGANT
jgi:tetratricopeptide (TPR) repeat protein